MKYIKTYEYTIEDNLFKIGNIVKCRNAESSSLIKDKCYTIENVLYNNNKNMYVELKELKYTDFDTDWNNAYATFRFTEPTPEEIKNYKLDPIIGDVIKCIDESDTNLIKNKCYTLSNITISKGKIYTYYELKENPKPNNLKYYNNRFTIATTEEIKQYNLEHNITKFNI